MCSVTQSNNLTKYLGPQEVLSSKDLIKRLTADGISVTYARQLLRRGAGSQNIWRSKSLVLPGGGRLFARLSFYKSDNFYIACIPVLDQFRPGIARVIHALSEEETMLRSRAEILLAIPVSSHVPRYPNYDTEIDALIELGVIRIEDTDGALERISFKGINDSGVSAYKAYARLTTEAIVAKILFEQFRRENLISWNRKSLPDQGHQLIVFNKFQFSAAGFSYIKPLLRYNKTEKPKPTPVILDVFMKKANLYDVQSFITRMERAGNNKTVRLPMMGIIAASDFDNKAWTLAKSNGLIAINLRQRFGEAAFEALAQVQELVKNVTGKIGSIENKGYEILADTLESLKTNPYIVDLRSLGFESVSGLILRTKGYDNVRLNLKASLNSGNEREVDVSGDKNGGEEIFILECKAEGKDKLLDVDYVRKFYTETVPAYLESQTSNKEIRECCAEIWTTGQVGLEAQEVLKSLKLKPFIKARLLGHDEVKEQIPQSLASCRRLIEAIAVR